MTTTFNVTNNNDTGSGSLREAIINLNSSPLENEYIINFNPGLNISILTNHEIISRAVTINGNNSTIVTLNGTSFFRITTTDLNVTINNLNMNNETSTLVRSLLICTSTHLTLVDCHITSNVLITSSISASKYGIVLDITGGSLNTISTYDGGCSIININFDIETNSENIVTKSVINAISCPITIGGDYKTIVNNIGSNFTSFIFAIINGVLITTDSSLSMRNVDMDNIMKSTFVKVGTMSNLIDTSSGSNVNVTLDNCNISNIGRTDNEYDIFTGIVTSSNSVNIVVNDCNISYITGGYIFYIPNSGSLTINAITKECTYSILIKCIFFYGLNATINIGNNSNYTLVFTNINSFATSTHGGLFHINTLDTSIFSNCLLMNVDVGGFNSGLYVETLNGNLAIENNNIMSVITSNHVITISNILLQESIITINNNTFRNINGGALLIGSKCKLVHGDNIIDNCSNPIASIVLNNVNTEFIGTNNTIISHTSSRGMNYNNLSNVNTILHFTFSNISNIPLTITNTSDAQSINILNSNFNNCNSCINITNELIEPVTSIITNCLFENNGISNGKYISLTNTICRILDCLFTSTVNSNVDGFIVTSDKYVEMINGIIITTNDITTSYSLIKITNDETLTIKLYDVKTNHKTVIDSPIVEAEYCNFKFTGTHNEDDIAICINANMYRLQGITIADFDTGVLTNDSSERTTVSNSTFSRNQIGIVTYNTDLINCTIMDNIIGIKQENGNSNIVNTLIASNTTNIDITNPESTITTLGNNATDVDTTSTFTLPTDIISPLVLENIGPLENNGGIPETYALLNNNVCINKGNVEYAVNMYDNRGEGYNRVVDGNVDIGSYENQNPIVCFTSDSEVLVDKNGVVCYDCVRNVVAGDMVVVNDISSGNLKLSKVVHNVITGKRKWFIRIEKDGIGIDEPFKTTNFTGGHMLIIGGKEIKARDIVGKNNINCSKVKLEGQDVHSLVLEDRSYVNVNGVLNVAFGREEWYMLVKRMNIVWRDNKLD